MLNILMHRLTARLLLVIVALGISQPLLEVFSAEPPHACCLRRMHAQKDRRLQFHDAAKPGGNCCPSLTTPHTANIASGHAGSFSPHVGIIRVLARANYYPAATVAHLSTRAPPADLIARS